MVFGYDNRRFINIQMAYDPAADDVMPLFRATQDGEIKSAYAIVTNNNNAADAGGFTLTLLNGGSIGTAVTAMSGTIGGTAGTPSWTGLTPESFIIADGTYSAGDVIVLGYDESSTDTFVAMTIQLELLTGIGADA